MFLRAFCVLVCVSAVTVSATTNYAVSSMSGYDKAYFITDNTGNVLEDPILTINPNEPVQFTINVQSQHPFVISTSPDSVDPTNYVSDLKHISGCVTGQDAQGNPVEGSWVTAALNEPCVLTYTPTATIATTPVYYHCINHPEMTGKIQAKGTDVDTVTPAPIKSDSNVVVPTVLVAMMTLFSVISRLF